jgi:nucleotide-binding universal stress UspA family protein
VRIEYGTAHIVRRRSLFGAGLPGRSGGHRGATIAIPVPVRIQRILAAVDFSPDSDRAARLAAELATRSGATLILVHVDPPPLLATTMVEPLFVPPQWLEAVRRRHDHEVQGKLAFLADRLRDASPGLAVERHQHLDEPAPGVVAAARERGADLIVMATRGAGASRFLLGSVTSKVAQHASCPVLVADRLGTSAAAGSFAKVIAAIDYSALSRPIAELAAAFVEPGGVVELAHVWHEPRLGWLRGHPEREQVVASGLDHASRRLAHFAGDAQIAHHQIERWIGTGNPAAALLDRSEEIGADLVVVGSHDRRGAGRGLGTVADRLLRHASCALLIVPAAAGVERAVDVLTAPQPGDDQ